MAGLNTAKKISELENEIKKLRQLVYKDELTSLYNRRGFKEEAERVFKTIYFSQHFTQRRFGFKVPLGLIFIDIDNFKKINDTFGHDSGDRVLKFASQTFSKNLRDSDIVGRWGGEEIIILLLGSDLESSKKVAENLRRVISKTPLKIKNKNSKITASFGVAVLNKEKTLQELIDKADKAMYIAKTKLGKNSVATL